MDFFGGGYSVEYVPIVAAERAGRSHTKIVKDGLRFFLIFFKLSTLYSPLKIFLPIAVSFLAKVLAIAT